MKKLTSLLFVAIFLCCTTGQTSYTTCDCKDYVIELFKSEDVLENYEGSAIMRDVILRDAGKSLGITEARPKFKSKCHEIIYKAKSSHPCIIELLNEWETR